MAVLNEHLRGLLPEIFVLSKIEAQEGMQRARSFRSNYQNDALANGSKHNI